MVLIIGMKRSRTYALRTIVEDNSLQVYLHSRVDDELADGAEGERGAEYKVRVTYRIGTVVHFEGERGVERDASPAGRSQPLGGRVGRAGGRRTAKRAAAERDRPCCEPFAPRRRRLCSL